MRRSRVFQGPAAPPAVARLEKTEAPPRCRGASIRGPGLGVFAHARRGRPRDHQDRVEVDEWVVARRVPIIWFGGLRVVPRIDRGVAAESGLAGGVVAHVLHVALPGETTRHELVGNRLDGRVDAALSERLPVQPEAGREKIREELAVGLRLRVRSLAAHHRCVVPEAQMRDRVVLGEEGALARQRLREVGRGRAWPEGHGGVLVLEHDDEHVADRRRLRRGRSGMRRCGEGEQG